MVYRIGDCIDIAKAKDLNVTLVEDIDPTTGEVLPDDSICNKADIVRAFLRHLKSS